MMMRKKLCSAVFGALALNAAPAIAQVESGTKEVHAYGGELFGDDPTVPRFRGERRSSMTT